MKILVSINIKQNLFIILILLFLKIYIINFYKMKNELPFQGQHRIPQIYLKQFGYLKNNEWYVSVYEIGKKTTSIEIYLMT